MNKEQYIESAEKTFYKTYNRFPVVFERGEGIHLYDTDGNEYLDFGAGIAVMGVFNLVRFRSIPGSAKDIGSVFLAMAIGLATGMGFIVLAVLFTIIVGIVNVAYVLSPFGRPQEPAKVLRVTVPEDLEFDGMFDDVLGRYTSEHELTEVRTTNMGSLYQLEYHVRLAQAGTEKRLMDEVRCLNGNLKVSLGNAQVTREVL